MRKSPVLVVLSIVVACAKQLSTQELSAKFTSNPAAFERLRAMIQEDTGSKECFVVGLDNIGDYWEHDGRWVARSDYQQKLDLPHVLKAVGLSSSRYEQYKSTFAESGSERVSYCQTGRLGPRASVLVYRAGLAVSGCIGSIDWRETPVSSEGQRGKGDFTEITPLSGGWYLEFSCT